MVLYVLKWNVQPDKVEAYKAWAAWYGYDDVQQVIAEARTMVNTMSLELWGPSPIVPQPIRPGG